MIVTSTLPIAEPACAGEADRVVDEVADGCAAPLRVADGGKWLPMSPVRDRAKDCVDHGVQRDVGVAGPAGRGSWAMRTPHSHSSSPSAKAVDVEPGAGADHRRRVLSSPS